jgi:pimeloyl-ACP methyl ester carboxylesterase
VLVVRLVAGLVIAYVALAALAWLFQDRLAFPAPRAALPDPARAGMAGGRVETLQLLMKDGTQLAGWFVPPADTSLPSGRGPGLLWFYGNGENIAAIWPVLKEFQPPGVALMVVDYPGYGASGGRTTEHGVYEAADLAYAALASRVARAQIFVYGRSLGTAVATRVAATHPVRGLILESPFTSARDMGRRHYAFFPVFLMRIELDNLSQIKRASCPVLVFHGSTDRLVPIEMGRRVAAAAPGPVEFVTIEGAGHNETYEIGGRAYRDKLWAFIDAVRRLK